MSSNNNNPTHANAQSPAHPGAQFSTPAIASPTLFDEMWGTTTNNTTPVAKAGSKGRSKRGQHHSGKKGSPPKKSQTDLEAGSPDSEPATRINYARGQAPKPDDSLRENIDEQVKLDTVKNTNIKATASHHCALTQCLVICVSSVIDYDADQATQSVNLELAKEAIEQFCVAKGLSNSGIICSVGNRRTVLRPSMELTSNNKTTAMGHHGDIICALTAGNPCCHDIAIPADPALKNNLTNMLAQFGIFIIAESDPFSATLLDTKKEIIRCSLGLTRPLQPIWEPVVRNNIPCEPAEGSCLVNHASLFFHGMQNYPTRPEASALFTTLCKALEYQLSMQKRPPNKDKEALKTFMGTTFLVVRVKAFAINRQSVRQFTFTSVSARNLAERLCIATGQAAAGLSTWAWTSVTTTLK